MASIIDKAMDKGGSKEKKVLGKGLSALIPEKASKPGGSRVENITIDQIKPNRFQPREAFDQKKLNELIASIKEKGVVQPLLVRPRPDGYELIAGERRLRAAKSLDFSDVPALIRDVEDCDMLGLALIENIQREELNPIEEAHAYQRLMDEFEFTQDRIGQVVGKDNTTISNSIRLLSLPKKIQDYLAKGALSVGHAKVIMGLASPSVQLSVSRKVAEKGISVRTLEKMVNKKPKSRKAGSVDYNLLVVEERLQQFLGTKVKIIRGRNKGRIEIEYYSDSDLERILGVLKAGAYKTAE